MYKMNCEELVPLITYLDGIKRLFFHRPQTDELYILKDVGYHNRLAMFGSFRFIYVEEKDLILQGKKSVIIR